MKRTSSFLRFVDFLLVVYSAKFKSKSLCKISKWELSRWPKVTKHRYATTILYFSYKYKTVDSKIQHFRRWVEFVMVWEIWILNLEGRSRCISFFSIGYETMTVIRARARAKPWKCPFKLIAWPTKQSGWNVRTPPTLTYRIAKKISLESSFAVSKIQQRHKFRMQEMVFCTAQLFKIC